MFKIVIVDDDRQMQAIIRDKIKEKTDAFRDAKIQIFSSAEAFLAEAKQEEHGEEGDLFFVDIELGDGITGLEFGRILRKKYPNRGLVFLTSHKEFAMESYEIEADQYILKEQMDKRLPGILEKLMYRLGAERNQYRMLRNEDGEQKIYFREMICIHKRKMGKYAEFETFQGTFRERISLDRLLEELDSKEFFLADRSNIINLRNVQSIRDNVICLEEGHTLELNQYRIEAVKWKQKIQEICEYKKALAILCITFLVLLRGYQIALGDMALGNRDMKGLTAAISMLVMFSMILGFLAFGHRFKMLKKENEMFAVREEMSRNHLEEIEKLMETNRIQIHDMRKHLLILKEYGQEQDWESLLRYLNELSNEMNQGKKSVWTHVKILDMVLNQEKIKAEKADIEFRIEEVAIGVLPFTDTEVCALFGNLLDNAIEACYKIKHKKKWITVRFLRKAKMLYIEIVNSIEKKPKEKSGKLISDKSKNEVHGYGLKSVQKIIAKYNGEFDYQIREEEFEVKITFFLLENGGNWNE